MRYVAAIVACVAMAVIGVQVLCGCEGSSDTRSLTVDPSFVDYTGGSTGTTNATDSVTQTFTVQEDSLQDLSLPLEWSVSDATLGYIGSSGGNSASYVRIKNKHGENSITVEDQYGARGVATVRQ